MSTLLYKTCFLQYSSKALKYFFFQISLMISGLKVGFYSIGVYKAIQTVSYT